MLMGRRWIARERQSAHAEREGDRADSGMSITFAEARHIE